MNTTNNSKKIKAAIYCRVSTLDQSRGEFSSLDAQEEQLKAYCIAKSWDVYDIYIDDGKTAANTNRPELQRLLSDAEAGKFQILISTKLDRISRNIHDWYKLIKNLESHDVQISVLDISLDTSTAVGRMVRDILIAFAQFERELISERTTEKKAATAKKGLWIGGTAPRGYDLIDGNLEPNIENIDIIKNIFLDFKKEPRPALIAKKLYDRGIKTPIHNTATGKTFGGKDYNVNIISKIIANPIYAGKIQYDNELYEGKHKAIISYTIWKECQKKANPAQSTRKGTSQLLLLSGIIKCGYCGSNMTTGYTTKNGKRHLYYQCTNVQKNGRKSCNQRNLQATPIENLVIQYCSELANDPKYINLTLSKLEKNNRSEIIKITDSIKRLNGQLAQVTNQQNNLLAVIKNSKPNSATNSLINELDKVEIESFNLKDKVSKLELIIKGLQQKITDPAIVTKYFSQFNERFNDFSHATKRNIINILIDNIIVKIHFQSKSGSIKIKPRNMAGVKFDENNLKSSSLGTNLYRERDSNPHLTKRLDPKSSASTNSAIPVI